MRRTRKSSSTDEFLPSKIPILGSLFGNQVLSLSTYLSKILVAESLRIQGFSIYTERLFTKHISGMSYSWDVVPVGESSYNIYTNLWLPLGIWKMSMMSKTSWTSLPLQRSTFSNSGFTFRCLDRDHIMDKLLWVVDPILPLTGQQIRLQAVIAHIVPKIWHSSFSGLTNITEKRSKVPSRDTMTKSHVCSPFWIKRCTGNSISLEINGTFLHLFSRFCTVLIYTKYLCGSRFCSVERKHSMDAWR